MKRPIDEFVSAYLGNLIYCVELAILGDIYRSLPAGSNLANRNLRTYNAFEHIVYFELSPRPNDGNPSTKLGIKRSIYTTYDAFMKSSEFRPYAHEIVSMSRQAALEREMHYEVNGHRNGEDVNSIYMLIHAPNAEGIVAEDHYAAYSRMIYVEDLALDLDRLATDGLELSDLLTSWKTRLSSLVDAGVSLDFFTSKEDGKRYLSYRKMVRDGGASGSESKWEWEDLPREEYLACIQGLNASRGEQLPIMPLD